MADIETESLNITLPSKIIVQMDAQCEELLKKRSEYIKDLIINDIRQSKLDLRKRT